MNAEALFLVQKIRDPLLLASSHGSGAAVISSAISCRTLAGGISGFGGGLQI